MAPASKRRKVATSRIERPRGVAEQFRQADVSGVKEVSKIFEGKELCVINAPREMSKQEIERKIVEVHLKHTHTHSPSYVCKCILQAGGLASLTPLTACDSDIFHCITTYIYNVNRVV